MSVYVPKTIKPFTVKGSVFYHITDFLDTSTNKTVSTPTVLRKCSKGTVDPAESDASQIKVGPQKFLNSDMKTGYEEMFNDTVLVVASVFVMFPDNTGTEVFFQPHADMVYCPKKMAIQYKWLG